jgi:hypothetical protein
MERREGSYLFIDGAYLRVHYDAAIGSVFGEPGELDYARISHSLQCAKAFYYDCLDEKRPLETTEDYGIRKEAQENFLIEFTRFPGFTSGPARYQAAGLPVSDKRKSMSHSRSIC